MGLLTRMYEGSPENLDVLKFSNFAIRDLKVRLEKFLLPLRSKYGVSLLEYGVDLISSGGISFTTSFLLSASIRTTDDFINDQISNDMNKFAHTLGYSKYKIEVGSISIDKGGSKTTFFLEIKYFIRDKGV
jgi:hypothetical protein